MSRSTSYGLVVALGLTRRIRFVTVTSLTSAMSLSSLEGHLPHRIVHICVDQVNVPVDLRARARLTSDCNTISAFLHALSVGGQLFRSRGAWMPKKKSRNRLSGLRS